MGSDKDDRRVKYTKMVLKESFISLLTQKDISRITIKEICEGADINRATFYAHYSDQYDLMRQMENELLENLGLYLSEYIQNQAQASMVEMVEKIFEYIKENAQLCRLLLGERGDLDIQKRIMMLAYDKNIYKMTTGKATRREEADYSYAYIITGCVGVVQKWLNENMQQSARFMAELLVKLAKGEIEERKSGGMA